MKKIYKLIYLKIILLSIGIYAQAPKILPPEINPKSILMVGNSFMYFNNGVFRYVKGLSKASNKQIQIRMITMNGSALNWHPLEAYLENNNIGSFSISSKNNYKKIKRLPIDMVIMQDCSQCPINQTSKFDFYETVNKNTKILRKRNIQPALMMTWAYKDRPNMSKKLADAYTKAGNLNDALVIPVGIAFSKATNQLPNIELYVKDLRHPSLAGSYLAACVIYGALFNQSPINNNYTASLNVDVAKKLQKIAWETLIDYYSSGV